MFQRVPETDLDWNAALATYGDRSTPNATLTLEEREGTPHLVLPSPFPQAWPIAPLSSSLGLVLTAEVRGVPIELQRDESGRVTEAHWTAPSGVIVGGARVD